MPRHFAAGKAGRPDLLHLQSTIISKALECPADTELGKQEHTGEALLLHLAEDHDYPRIRRCPFCGLLTAERVLTTHVRRHFGVDDDPVPCPWCVKSTTHKDEDIGETTKPELLFSDYSTWAAHVASMPSHGIPATASGRSRSATKRKMQADFISHDEGPPSPPPGAGEELGGDVMQVISALPSPPLSTQAIDEGQVIRPNPTVQDSAKRTRHDYTDEMVGLTSTSPIDSRLTMEDGTSFEDEFVFVEDGEDDEDEDVEEKGPQDLQLEDEDFCVVGDDDDDSEVEW
ncbi:hypothetical protein MMC29_002495 [Sticta canariensis]|nr:hypothetical protein [Sticta canariensis]